MYLSLLGLLLLLSFFISILIFIKMGRSYEIWEHKISRGKKTARVQIAEAAIFALLGLLVAFTFSSAANKFDNRRQLIIQEANAVSTAFLRLSLLPEETFVPIKQEFITYLDLRSAFYKNLKDYNKAQELNSQGQTQQNVIWQKTVKACQASQTATSCMLVLPALNSMFDIATERVFNTFIHPPKTIFALLVGIALLTALLTGYSISRRKSASKLHIISYTIVISIVIYVIIDLEFPRLGFIQISQIDQAFNDVVKSIKQ